RPVMLAKAGRWIHISSATDHGRKPLPEFCSQDTFSEYDYRSAPNRANGHRLGSLVRLTANHEQARPSLMSRQNCPTILRKKHQVRFPMTGLSSLVDVAGHRSIGTRSWI